MPQTCIWTCRSVVAAERIRGPPRTASRYKCSRSAVGTSRSRPDRLADAAIEGIVDVLRDDADAGGADQHEAVQGVPGIGQRAVVGQVAVGLVGRSG